MFERRLRLLLWILALPALALILRLVQLQVFSAGSAQQQTEALLFRDPEYFPCLRGSITDRFGVPLAYDAPSWDIEVYYGALDLVPDYIDPLARKELPEAPLKESREIIFDQIRESWLKLAEITGRDIRELDEIRAAHVERVKRIKESVSARHKVEIVVAEEKRFFPVHRRLTQAEAVAARMELKDYPWIRVRKSHARRYDGGPAVGHLLGHMGEVSEEARKNDPNIDDPLSRYLLGERRGVSGMEWLGEQRLRGTRGREHVDRTGKELSPYIEPVNGRDLRLTIDLRLQQALYNQLAAAVEQTGLRSGGSAVLLDVTSRQILAIVNYPAPEPDPSAEAEHRFSEDDRIRQRYQFRAVRSYYPPGSIVKPMVLTAALTEGAIAPDTRLLCQGRLFANSRSWRCEGIHGWVEPIFAIQHSCNVFFYKVGERIGVERLVPWMEQFGFGHRTGSLIPGELPGRLPEDVSTGSARNTAIGQGGLNVTPIQAANMAATIAAGAYRQTTISLDDTRERPPEVLSVPDTYWRIVREGMYKVVNESGGTAYGPNRGTLEDVQDYVMLGKTGSAQPWSRTIDWAYTIRLPNGETGDIIAHDRSEVLERFPDAEIVDWHSNRRWPDQDPMPTHAWFVGYLAPRDRYLQPVRSDDISVAVAVVIEYSGHGGDIAAPVARQIMQSVILRYAGSRAYVSRDGSVQ